MSFHHQIYVCYGKSSDCKHLVCDVMMGGPNVGLRMADMGIQLGYDPDHPNSLVLHLIQYPPPPPPPYRNTTFYTNIYSVEGFEAYSIGCLSQLSGYACINYDDNSSTDHTKAIIIAMVVLGIVLACAGAYAWLWWVRRPQATPTSGGGGGGYGPLASGIQSDAS